MSNRPIPTKIKELTGNPGKRAINKREPKVAPISVEPPSSLNVAEKKVWRRILSVQAPGLITAADEDILIAYCDAVVMLQVARKELRKNFKAKIGLTTETERGWVRNPLTTVIKECRDQIRYLGAELGLTPASRTKLEVPEGAVPEDPWAKLVGMNGRKQEPARC